MIGIRRTIRSALGVMTLTALLSACGGGSSAPSPTGPTGNDGDNPAGNGGNPPAEIQGIATPSSVSVVTATNAD